MKSVSERRGERSHVCSKVRSLTVAFGEAYIGTLQALFAGNPDRELSAQEVADAFKKRMDA